MLAGVSKVDVMTIAITAVLSFMKGTRVSVRVRTRKMVNYACVG